MHYEFTDNLRTGNELIDKEHEKVIDAVNDLLVSISEWKEDHKDSTLRLNAALNFLSEYVVRHFNHEEALAEAYQHPERFQHAAWHKRYRNEIMVLFAEFAKHGPCEILVDEAKNKVEYIINHILTADRRLAEYIQEQENK